MSCFQVLFVYFFFHELFSTNTLVEAEVDDAMDYTWTRVSPGMTLLLAYHGRVVWGVFFIIVYCPSVSATTSIFISFVITLLGGGRTCEGGGLFFAVLLLWKNKGFPLESVGVFLGHGTSTSGGRFCNASTSLTAKPRPELDCG